MVRTYIQVLPYDQADRFKTHLRNMGVKYDSGEVGGHQYIQFDYEETEIVDIKVLLDETKAYCWAQKAIKSKN